VRRTTGVLVLTAALLQATGCCQNDLVAKVPSPDGQRVAVNYLRSCGVGTTTIARVAIVPTGGRPVSGRSDVFEAEDTVTAAIPADTTITAVRMAWRGPDTLEITHDPRAGTWLKPGGASHVVVITRVLPRHQ